MNLKQLIIGGTLLLIINLFSLNSVANSNKIVITEFMAINSKTIADEDGDFSDWIEIHNPGKTDVNLNGWYLTDKSDDLKKWKFPAINLKANAYLVIFASEKKRNDPTKNLHTNFKLSGSGEYLAICEPDSTISSSYNPQYSAQRKDVSYGIYQGEEVFFTTPTPGSANVFGELPFTPNFSITRGFYKTAVDVTLSTPGSGNTIYYTLDGTIPTKTTGTIYKTPIHITKTTPLSAVSINSSNVSSEIVTNTYWFIDDIIKQSNTPEGYPQDWKMAASKDPIPADYEMDPEVCNAPEYKHIMEDALTIIPSMNIVTSIGYLFSDANSKTDGGIYIYTGKPNANGLDWVRPTSVEYFDPKTGKEFQINCRLKLHGGNSRNPGNSSKHGFELTFNEDYGPSKLNFNLFEEKDVANEFNNLVLRAGYNYSWTKNNLTQRINTQYLNDPWSKNTQLAMGKTSAHERFVHLYINGLYWGLYNISEKYSNDFFETYMKGKEDDFDIIKEKQTVSSGNINAYNELISQMNSNLSENANYQKLQGKNPDGTVNESYLNLLDLDNYIDYMLVNYYIGNGDWNSNNWVMARNRVTNEAGFRFMCWDTETSFTDVNVNLVKEKGDSKTPMSFIDYLSKNEDFKILLADRIQKHMIDEGGALTPDEAIDRYVKLADEIDLPIICESARWGDYRKDVAPNDDSRILYTRNDHWLPRKQDLLDNYFPKRTDIVIEQLIQKGLFPNLSAPVFSDYGGKMSSSIELEITSNSTEIYFTIYGTDPREQISSKVSSTAQLYSSKFNISSNLTVKARAKSGNTWSPITKAKFDFNNLTALNDLKKSDVINIGNYPNPFSESTRIYYTLPKDTKVEIDIIGLDGRYLKKFYSCYQFKGYNTFDWTPANIKTGIYIYRVHFENQIHIGKLIYK